MRLAPVAARHASFISAGGVAIEHPLFQFRRARFNDRAAMAQSKLIDGRTWACVDCE
jgi:hypothetical protein